MRVGINETIRRIVEDSLAELNEQRSKDLQLSFEENCVLYGKGGKLDSLGLVQFIVALEQRCESQFGSRPNLAALSEHSEKGSPFSNINDLCIYLTAMYN